MKDVFCNSEAAASLSPRDFERLSDLIRAQCGIKMPKTKKIMLEARLIKRLRSLGISSFHEYCDYLIHSSKGEKELVHMIDTVTTNKTEFFREPAHFHFLIEHVLSDFINAPGAGVKKAFAAWSAGCSTGEEPYTLAMVLSDFTSQNPGFTYSILATDISTKVLEKAKLGIYEQESALAVPRSLRQKYLMRSKDRDKDLVRIVPELRALVRFERINLMDEHFMIQELMNVIFCRNVIIYFERDTQCELLGRLSLHLKPGGYLFLGHSETVHGFDLPLVRMASTIYRKVL